MSILIVDDDAELRALLDLTLAEAGLGHPIQAASGIDALDLLGIADPFATPEDLDLILLDIQLPGMDGIEVCARIKAHPHFYDVPIVMLTSVNTLDALQMAFVAGATDYVVKPVLPVELLARTRAALRLKHELDRRKAREVSLMAARERITELETLLRSYGEPL